jgi:imidazolonepropionase-like amidohydrolase
VVIIGGRDSWQIVDFLRDNNVAVILGRIHSLPTGNDSDIDQPYKTAAALYQAGVRFGISIEGFWQLRNLPFQAGTAVAYGLPYEQGIKAISGGIADILGVGNRLGTLEAGKAATLFIAAGDVLDMRSSVVDTAFIDGRLIDLNNVQRQLYERFQEKYDRQKD